MNEKEYYPDIHFQPTPMGVVRGMMDLASVGPADTVMDLGSGDGRIVMEAARRGAQGIGVEIDAQLIAQSRARSLQLGHGGKVHFLQENLLDTDLREATVVMLFLSSELGLQLRPRLLRDLKPGARVVSHMYRIGDWAPAMSATAPGPLRDHPIYLWTLNQAA
jgi:16S rRNA A1518/A1519 N6-dimethyltransferase RsmA/KsgA/DIM1 with predicted DNA glycosylase/AP lyase activity